MSRRVIVGLAAVLLVAVGLLVALRSYAARRFHAALLVPAPAASAPPTDADLPRSDFRIAVGGRELHARLVRPADTAAIGAAVLVFHGNRTSVAEQLGIQETLRVHGIASMVFDYAGFGTSTGTPSVAVLREDAVAAFGAFSDSVGPAAYRYAMGTSVGAAVLLSVIDELEDGIDGVVVIGTFASARETALRGQGVPRFLRFLIPDVYDNVAGVRRLAKPLLVVHSESDEVFPIADAEALVAAAGGASQLVRLSDVAHNQYLVSAAHWTPVLRFFSTGGLLPERVPRVVGLRVVTN